jgi:lipopolysaccharide export LptBFGC system permease protein LptF
MACSCVYMDFDLISGVHATFLCYLVSLMMAFIAVTCCAKTHNRRSAAAVHASMLCCVVCVHLFMLFSPYIKLNSLDCHIAI